MQSRGTAHSIRLENEAYHQFVTPNQAKIIIPIISPGPPRCYFLTRSLKAFSLTSYSMVIAYSLLELRCQL